MSTPYVIEVAPEHIREILQVLSDNELLHKVKLETVLEDEFSQVEIYHILKQKECFRCYQKSIENCVICARSVCDLHAIKCKFCKKYVCSFDTSLNFTYNTHTGQECCKNCEYAS